MLKKVGIVKRKNNKSYKIFNKYISDNFLDIPKMRSSEYVKFCWNKYLEYEKIEEKDKQKNSDNSLNGLIFELIISSELYRQGLEPMFIQAEVAFVPNVKFDILFYTKEQFPIGLSLKTSLRERYKQADL